MAISDMHTERTRAFAARGGARQAPCDYCLYILERDEPLPAIEYHHIFPKKYTVRNAAARAASNSRYLCACLCRDCHRGSHNVHHIGAGMDLLAVNMQLFGRAAVQEAYDDLAAALNRKPYIPLPDERSVHHNHEGDAST